MRRALGNQKLIFIDFDDVLLNTKTFRKELFSGLGVPYEYAVKCYVEMQNMRGRYDPYPYFTFIRRCYPGMRYRRLMQMLNAKQMRTRRHVFRDSEKFLRWLRNNGWRIELVSSGNYAMQKRKILGSGLAEFFHKIHIVAKTPDKGKEMKKVLNGRRVNFVFIDDVKVIVDDVKKSHPEAFVIQMVRHPDQEISKRVDTVVKNFSEVKKLLKIFYEA